MQRSPNWNGFNNEPNSNFQHNKSGWNSIHRRLAKFQAPGFSLLLCTLLHFFSRSRLLLLLFFQHLFHAESHVTPLLSLKFTIYTQMMVCAEFGSQTYLKITSFTLRKLCLKFRWFAPSVFYGSNTHFLIRNCTKWTSFSSGNFVVLFLIKYHDFLIKYAQGWLIASVFEKLLPNHNRTLFEM